MNHPLLLGHRGVRATGRGRLTRNLPEENSLAAFDYALARGCDGIEFDVRHTRDGRNVIWHDPEWAGQSIAATDYSNLTNRTGDGPALLEDVLQKLGPRAYLDIELKVAGGEESILAALREAPPQHGFIVSSFLPEVHLRLRDIAPDLPMGFICDGEDAISLWRELPIQVLLPHYRLVQPELIDEAHQRGLEITTWTVNDAARMRQLASWGIDGLISDDPAGLYQTFHSD